MKPPPPWIVPLESGPLTDDGARIQVDITEQLEIAITMLRDGHGRPDSSIPLCPLPSLVAVQLGAAIQSSAVWAGQEKARREMRKR